MRAYNFGAGPATLPESVLQSAADELLDWQGQGMSILEIGHRTEPFHELMQTLEADLRELMGIPAGYHVLFLGTPARSQFSMIPLNLLGPEMKAGHLISGTWSQMAFQEAARLKKAYCVASSEQGGYVETPHWDDKALQDNTAYLYYTSNETIHGVRFSEPPKVTGIPLVADMTSSILTEPIDVTQFGLIFAGAQKNLGIAGLTVVIIHPSLLQWHRDEKLPIMFDYKTHIEHRSLYATPPVFSIYMASKLLKWMKAEGGVHALYEHNLTKSALLYEAIDASSFYEGMVKPHARSLVNVCFRLKDKTLESDFLMHAKQQGLLALQGHRSLGGLRASLYNAMPKAGVLALIACLKTYSKAHP